MHQCYFLLFGIISTDFFKPPILLLRLSLGTIHAPPAQFGETLETEQLKGGTFLDWKDMPIDKWERIMELEVGNTHHRLFGGAQYHR